MAKSDEYSRSAPDGDKTTAPSWPDSPPKVQIPDHATSDEHAVKREREAELKRDKKYRSGR